MLKRTFLLGLVLGALIAAMVGMLIQAVARPFTLPQLLLLFFSSFLPGFGLALFTDPYSKRKKEEYLQIDFYKEEA